jgi:hypothetical protein
MHGMDRKALVDRAHHITTLMSNNILCTVPPDPKFVGTTILHSEAVLPHLNSAAATNWIKANIEEFMTALGPVLASNVVG